ncbi:hypothetical protein J2X72_003346 [Phyllobacterium sp. 1468]|uniref:hypothetical protein n=1 Tax=Phyllobacterium sp. 1468 TaxID=2817759 RepID=UPI0028627154|nr:hypothetical protein [Phyllobacterium sp. 1468]MDR6634536.1 hypothetical protein [Phyllobacterium sp. 1468]
MDLLVEDGRIIITPVRDTPRSGWAEDAKRIAENNDDALVWPEFPNEDDGELKW